MDEIVVADEPAPAAPRPLWKRILQFPLVALILAFLIVTVAQALAAGASFVAGTPQGQLASPSDIVFSLAVTVLVVLAYKLVVVRLGEHPRDDLPFDGRARDAVSGFAQGTLLFSAIVGVADVNGQTAHDVTAAIGAAGGKAFAYEADLGRRQAFFDVAAAFARDAGPLRAVINNASVLVYEPIEQVTEETLDRMLSAGLKSVFWGVQAFLAHRDESAPGNILNYSSPVAYRGRPNTGAYTTIKAGIAGLTKVLAGELGPRGIRVNAIAPGSVPTPATEGFVTPEQYEQRAKNIPLRRNGTPDDVAKAVAFLLSDDAAFINGAMLAIDGGIIAAG